MYNFWFHLCAVIFGTPEALGPYGRVGLFNKGLAGYVRRVISNRSKIINMSNDDMLLHGMSARLYTHLTVTCNYKTDCEWYWGQYQERLALLNFNSRQGDHK